MNKELEILNNLEVLQLRIGRYQVVFTFENDTSLSIEGPVDYRIAGVKSRWVPEDLTSAGGMAMFVGRTVASVGESKNELLIVTFEDGEFISVTRSSFGETYQLTSPQGVYVV